MKTVIILAALLFIPACSVEVRPSADRIINTLERNGDLDLVPWLSSRGFKPKPLWKKHSNFETHLCWEKANGTAMLWVGGVDVVRVCQHQETKKLEILNFQTHSPISTLYTFDPKTGSMSCEITYPKGRCEK